MNLQDDDNMEAVDEDTREKWYGTRGTIRSSLKAEEGDHKS